MRPLMTTYRDAGVDIDAGDEFVDRISPLVRSTFRPEVLTDLGGFGGLFKLQRLLSALPARHTDEREPPINDRGRHRPY